MSDIVSAASVCLRYMGLLVLLEFVCSSQQQQQHRGASEQLLWTFFKAVTKGLASSAFVMTALHALHAASGRDSSLSVDSVRELLHRSLSAGLETPQELVPTLIVIGLALGWLGDMLLVVPSTFLLGLVSFLLGHVAYVAAFVASGIEQHFTMFGALAVVAHGAPILVWLLPHVERPMKLPVLAYVFVITLMVVAAVGSYGHSFVLEHPSLSRDNVADLLLNATLVTGTGSSSSDTNAAIGSAVATPVSIAFRRLLAAELFFLSDICVARSKFVVQSFLNPLFGLPLYYVAQLLFAASL